MKQRHRLLDSDAAFFSPGAAPSGTAVRDLVRGGFRGIAIDAPFWVDTAVQDRLPVMGIFARQGGEGSAFFRRAMAIVVDTQGGGATVVQAFASLDGDEPHPEGAGGPAGGIAVENFSLDLRAIVDGLPWGCVASWRLFIAYEGWISNGITIATTGGGTASSLPRPPAAERISPASPGGLDGTGLVVSLPSTATTEPAGRVLIEGRLAGTGAARPVTLVALGAAPTPFVASVDVPLEGGEGSFSVNLLGDNPLPKAPGTWHVYAFAGEHAAGPATIELTPGSKPW